MNAQERGACYQLLISKESCMAIILHAEAEQSCMGMNRSAQTKICM